MFPSSYLLLLFAATLLYAFVPDAEGQAAGTPEMGVAVLDFLLGQEELLLRFCDSAEIEPKDLHLARHVLGGA